MFILDLVLILLAAVGGAVVVAWVFVGFCAGVIKFWIFVTKNKGNGLPWWTFPDHLIECILRGVCFGFFMYAYVGAVELDSE